CGVQTEHNRSQKIRCVMGVTRPNYFTGQLLTAEDLRAEQEYFLHKNRLHHRCLHGFGVACGLGISVGKGGSPQITVEPGLALDCAGNMIEVDQAQQTTLKAPDKQKVCYIVLEYHECLSDPVPAPISSGESALEETQMKRVNESFKLSFQENSPLT